MNQSIYHARYVALQQHMRDLRKRAGLTQVQLAERLSLDQSYVSKIERGERYVDVLLYIDWCKACEVPPPEAINQLIFF